MKKARCSLVPLAFLLVLACSGCAENPASKPPPAGPFTDFRYEKPGTVHKITRRDLPAPYATKSATNGPDIVDRPKNAWPQAPAGFKVELYTTDVQNPRKILPLRTATSSWPKCTGRYQDLPWHHTDGKPKQKRSSPVD